MSVYHNYQLTRLQDVTPKSRSMGKSGGFPVYILAVSKLTVYYGVLLGLVLPD